MSGEGSERSEREVEGWVWDGLAGISLLTFITVLLSALSEVLFVCFFVSISMLLTGAPRLKRAGGCNNHSVVHSSLA